MRRTTCILLFSSAAASVLIGGLTSAAETASNPANAPSIIQPQSSVGGLRMADESAVAVRYTAITPADTVASRILGLKVYNNQNEALGEISDLVINNGRTLSGIVVGIGGFLGIGKSYVLIDPASMVISTRDSVMRANIDTSRDNLKAAPKFTYEKVGS